MSAGLFQAVDDGDVRVVQRRERASLAHESRESVGVLREDLWQDLDCDIATKSRIARAIHLAHAAQTDLVGNFIWSKASARRQRHLPGHSNPSIHLGLVCHQLKLAPFSPFHRISELFNPHTV